MEAFVEASVIVYCGDSSASVLHPVIIKAKESELCSRHGGATMHSVYLQFFNFAGGKKSQYFSMSHLFILVHLFVLKYYSNNILVDNMQNSKNVYVFI